MRNLKNQPDGSRHKDYARSSVADERQRNAFHRYNADHGANINERLNAQPCEDAHGD
jgi:hypothetical protein